MLEELKNYVKKVNAKPGEVIQFGWLIIKVTGGSGSLEYEAMDFVGDGRYTSDLRKVSEIFEKQLATLKLNEAKTELCNHQQCALVPRELLNEGEINRVYMIRTHKAERNDSGWFIGLDDESVDIDDHENLIFVSTYSLSIKFPELLPFWLLPIGFEVDFENGVPKVHLPKE